MDSEIINRLKELRGILGKNQTQFGEGLGLTQKNISDLEKGKTEIYHPFLLAIEYIYGIRVEWILTGKGVMNRVNRNSGTNGLINFPLKGKNKNLRDLINKTIEVLESETGHAGSLEKNINSFHEAVEDKKKLESLKKVGDEVAEA